MLSNFEDANKWSTWDEDQQRCHAYLHLSTLEKCTICKEIEKRSHNLLCPNMPARVETPSGDYIIIYIYYD
jgi:ribosomal protein L32